MSLNKKGFFRRDIDYEFLARCLYGINVLLEESNNESIMHGAPIDQKIQEFLKQSVINSLGYQGYTVYTWSDRSMTVGARGNKVYLFAYRPFYIYIYESIYSKGADGNWELFPESADAFPYDLIVHYDPEGLEDVPNVPPIAVLFENIKKSDDGVTDPEGKARDMGLVGSKAPRGVIK